jgi:hypothetical protein
MGLAQHQALFGHLGGLLPLTGEEGVIAQQEQRFDGRGDRTALAAVPHDLSQRRPAVGRAVEVGSRDSGAHNAGWDRFLAQPGDKGVEPVECGQRQPDRVGERLGQDAQ